jgi:outer membrane protein assembly factor BamB
MQQKSTLLKLTFVLALVCTATTFAADWAQYQGPMRNGASPETGIAREWPEGGPKTLWSAPLGEGFGGPAIRDGEVYIVDRVSSSEDIVRCLSLDTGEELWTYTYDAPGETSFNGSRSAPTVTEKFVYTVGLMGQMHCLDRKTHQPVWTANLLDDFGHEELPGWGFSQSPLLHKDLVIVAPQSPNHTVAAFNQDTGELAWKSDFLGETGYVSPIIANLAGVEQVIMSSAGGSVSGISPIDGQLLWQYTGWTCDIPITLPVPLSDDRLFITGEYGAGSVMVKIVGSGSTLKVEELFVTDVCGAQIHQPLLHEGYLYMNSNGNSRKDGMLCLDLDGNMKWRTQDDRKLPNFERGGLLLVDNMILNFDGKTGKLHLVDPSPEGYQEIASAQIFEGKQMWAPMALSNGKLILRSQEEVRCLDLVNP